MRHIASLNTLATAELTGARSANQRRNLLESLGFVKLTCGAVEVIDAVGLHTLGATAP